ncbi:glutathione S-transferase family protein [Colwellia sp. MEBiC06753]
MSLILHHCHESRSMRSLWLIHELGLPVQVEVHSFGPALRDPNYLENSPLGRVPCLIDGELTLFESGAIAEYLCERYDNASLWRGLEHSERPQWLQWLHYAETITVHCASLTQQAIVINDESLRSPTVWKLESRRLEKAIEVIENHLADQPYLLTSGFSAVDIGVGYPIHVAQYFVDMKQFPNVQAYYQRLSERPAFQKSLPADDDPLKIYRQRFY